MFHRDSRAGELCTRIVSVVYPALSIDEAARVMRDQHVGCLVVVEASTPQARRVVGMLTDRDIVTGAVAAQRDPLSLRVADLMSRDVVSAREDDTLLNVLAVMRHKAVRRLPVLGGDGILVGVLSLDDLLAAVSQELQALAAAIAAAQRHELAQAARA